MYRPSIPSVATLVPPLSFGDASEVLRESQLDDRGQRLLGIHGVVLHGADDIGREVDVELLQLAPLSHASMLASYCNAVSRRDRQDVLDLFGRRVPRKGLGVARCL